MDLNIRQQSMLVVNMVLTSKGLGGAGFMFAILLATLGSEGIRLEGIEFLASFYRILYLGSATKIVLGNALSRLVMRNGKRTG